VARASGQLKGPPPTRRCGKDRGRTRGLASAAVAAPLGRLSAGIVRERAAAGAAGEGRWYLKGRPPSIEGARVRELKAQGMRPVDIAKALKIGRASVYRVLGHS
jgi:DNA invertase Pin-like site-specific DNA recombinase